MVKVYTSNNWRMTAFYLEAFGSPAEVYSLVAGYLFVWLSCFVGRFVCQHVGYWKNVLRMVSRDQSDGQKIGDFFIVTII